MTNNNLQNLIDDQEEPSKSLEMDQTRAMESISYKQIQNNIVDYKLMILLSSEIIFIYYFLPLSKIKSNYMQISKERHIIILDLYVQNARNQ